MKTDGNPIRPLPPAHTPDDPGPLVEHLEHFRRRVLQDALLEGTAIYWRRRAATFAAVGTPACDEIAQACENAATFVTMTGLDAEATALIDDIAGTLYTQAAS